MKRQAFALFMLAAVSTSALAIGGEYLFVGYQTLLPGWTVLPAQRGGNVELVEIVPPGQNQKDWVDQVAVNSFFGPPQKSAQELLAERIEQISRECEDTALGPVSPLVENGYETALRAVACTKVKKWDQGEVSLYKAWRGKDAMYLVARSWRGAAFDRTHVPVTPDVTHKWLEFIQSIVLCDTRDAAHPCPVAAPKP